MLDLFAGELGWASIFSARGWKVTAIDLVEPSEIPDGMEFYKSDVLEFSYKWVRREGFDFVCASPPCEEFSVHGMKHFHLNPKHPELGIKLFNYTRDVCELSKVPYVIENVRAAQQFVGKAVHHCGPFYLWGNAVPPILPQGIIKGMTRLALGYREQKGQPGWNTKNVAQERRRKAKENASTAATIPPELANCVAEYAERLLEVKRLADAPERNTRHA